MHIKYSCCCVLPGNVTAIELLSKHNADLEVRDKTGSTALHWATDGKHFEVVRWMVNKGVQVVLQIIQV